MHNDLTGDTVASIKDALENKIDPAKYCWPFNGLKANNEAFGMDMGSFVSWASAIHPEYIDEETGLPLIYDFVFTRMDAELLGMDDLEGCVMVTIRPDLDGGTSYTLVARRAAERYPANPKVASRFLELAELFAQKGM